MKRNHLHRTYSLPLYLLDNITYRFFKGIREEVEEKKLPEEIYEVEYVEDSEDEDYVDRGQLLRRLKNLKTSVNDNVARLETLCVCWNKLNADMNELTDALR